MRKTRLIKWTKLALAMLGLLFISGCLNDSESVHLKGRTMGTHYNIKYYTGPSTSDADDIQKDIEELLVKLNKEMSTYLKGSEISYFNETDRLGWLKIGQDFYTVTDYALKLARLSDGAFDPTIGPLVNLWGFGPGGKRRVPKPEQIEAARKRVGYDKINLNSQNLEIKKKVPGVYLDLSALAKGYGVDKVGKFLESEKVKSYMVEIGGEVKTKGTKENKEPWRIAIEAPHPDGIRETYQRVLPLKDMSLATSGSYRNFFEQDGKKYSHTIDAKTGKPVAHALASVSVAHPESCMKADAMATALMAMGVSKGYEFAVKQKIPAFFVYRDEEAQGRVFVTKETPEFHGIFKESDKTGVE